MCLGVQADDRILLLTSIMNASADMWVWIRSSSCSCTHAPKIAKYYLPSKLQCYFLSDEEMLSLHPQCHSEMKPGCQTELSILDNMHPNYGTDPFFFSFFLELWHKVESLFEGCVNLPIHNKSYQKTSIAAVDFGKKKSNITYNIFH